MKKQYLNSNILLCFTFFQSYYNVISTTFFGNLKNKLFKKKNFSNHNTSFIDTEKTSNLDTKSPKYVSEFSKGSSSSSYEELELSLEEQFDKFKQQIEDIKQLKIAQFNVNKIGSDILFDKGWFIYIPLTEKKQDIWTKNTLTDYMEANLLFKGKKPQGIQINIPSIGKNDKKKYFIYLNTNLEDKVSINIDKTTNYLYINTTALIEEKQTEVKIWPYFNHKKSLIKNEHQNFPYNDFIITSYDEKNIDGIILLDSQKEKKNKIKQEDKYISLGNTHYSDDPTINKLIIDKQPYVESIEQFFTEILKANTDFFDFLEKNAANGDNKILENMQNEINSLKPELQNNIDAKCKAYKKKKREKKMNITLDKSINEYQEWEKNFLRSLENDCQDEVLITEIKNLIHLEISNLTNVSQIILPTVEYSFTVMSESILDTNQEEMNKENIETKTNSEIIESKTKKHKSNIIVFRERNNDKVIIVSSGSKKVNRSDDTLEKSYSFRILSQNDFDAISMNPAIDVPMQYFKVYEIYKNGHCTSRKTRSQQIDNPFHLPEQYVLCTNPGNIQQIENLSNTHNSLFLERQIAQSFHKMIVNAKKQPDIEPIKSNLLDMEDKSEIKENTQPIEEKTVTISQIIESIEEIEKDYIQGDNNEEVKTTTIEHSTIIESKDPENQSKLLETKQKEEIQNKNNDKGGYGKKIIIAIFVVCGTIGGIITAIFRSKNQDSEEIPNIIQENNIEISENNTENQERSEEKDDDLSSTDTDTTEEQSIS